MEGIIRAIGGISVTANEGVAGTQNIAEKTAKIVDQVNESPETNAYQYGRCKKTEGCYFKV